MPERAQSWHPNPKEVWPAPAWPRTRSPVGFLESLPSITTHLVALLIGVFIGAAGQYLGQRFTDQRRSSEEDRKARRRFEEVRALMPGLIAAMQKDLLEDKSGTVREFCPLNPDAIFGATGLLLYYDPADFPNLENSIHVLENHRYILDVSEGHTPRYRLTEEFVRLVKEAKVSPLPP